MRPTGHLKLSFPGRSDEIKQRARYVSIPDVCFVPSSQDASSIARIALLLTQAHGPSSGFLALMTYTFRSRRSRAASTRSIAYIRRRPSRITGMSPCRTQLAMELRPTPRYVASSAALRYLFLLVLSSARECSLVFMRHTIGYLDSKQKWKVID